jgi:2-polyprenyl-6-methoxyphenol hydroxylase-like FAD-dependent oxidoreductase
MPEVAIVGAGPVGLFLALTLVGEGVGVRVFERRPERRAGSRSIGIHPPSLELLDGLGLAERFLARGVRVKRGLAYGASGRLGELDFGLCPGPHRHVLTIPQHDTEAILRDALEERAPAAVQTARLVGLDPREEDVGVRVCTPDGSRRELRCPVVVGADGKHSAVRTALGVAFDGAAYPGSYVMSDFPDDTGLGDDALVFVGAGGLVESFPLPGGVRRWVARCPEGRAPDLDTLVDRVLGRTGFRLDRGAAIDPSAFVAERFHARELASGRVALVGDAAHVISPIGGQGMNLGWLGARSLATTLARALRAGSDPSAALATDGRRRARLARAAARRAEVNMWLGRPLDDAATRDRWLAGLMKPPAAAVLARVFTMRGLALGV